MFCKVQLYNSARFVKYDFVIYDHLIFHIATKIRGIIWVMNGTTLHIPVTKSLLSQAQTEALSQGFSSVEEATIAFLKKFVQKMITLSQIKRREIKFPEEILTPRQEAVLTEKWQKAKKELAKGNGVTVSTVKEMITYLES